MPRSVVRTAVLALALAGAASAQVAQNMSLVSQIPFPPCTTGDVWGIGNTMLLARRWQGFAVVDLKDPANPVTKTILPPGYPAGVWTYGVGDIKSDGRYIYATDEGTFEGVFIYDAKDPMNPVLLSTLRPFYGPLRVHNCWIDGNTLYAENAVFDVSDHQKPRYLTTIGSVVPHDIAVFDHRAYLSLWSQGIEIYDVSNPRIPVLIGKKTYTGSATHNMWPTEDRSYLYTTDEVVGGHVRIWDIRDLKNIHQVGEWSTGPTGSVVHNVQVHGNLLYVSYYKEGVRVLDISDPVHPVEIAWYDTYPPLGDGCFGGPYAGNWGVYPYSRDHVFVSDMDSGGYVLQLDTVTQTLSARSNPVAAGGVLTVDFSLTNQAPTTLPAFGLLLLADVGGYPSLYPLVIDLPRLQPNQQAAHVVKLGVPAAFPPGFTLGFIGYTGLASPLTLSEQHTLRVTVQ